MTDTKKVKSVIVKENTREEHNRCVAHLQHKGWEQIMRPSGYLMWKDPLNSEKFYFFETAYYYQMCRENKSESWIPEENMYPKYMWKKN